MVLDAIVVLALSVGVTLAAARGMHALLALAAGCIAAFTARLAARRWRHLRDNNGRFGRRLARPEQLLLTVNDTISDVGAPWVSDRLRPRLVDNGRRLANAVLVDPSSTAEQHEKARTALRELDALARSYGTLSTNSQRKVAVGKLNEAAGQRFWSITDAGPIDQADDETEN
jgi:hypothetical protein